jgi:hypothetical protein
MAYGKSIAKIGKLYFMGVGSAIEASSTYLLAEMEGNVVFGIDFTELESLENDVVVKDTAVTRADYNCTFERVHFKPTKLFQCLYGITGTQASILNTAAPTATVWEFTTGTEPAWKTFLFSYTRDNDDEINQLHIMKASLPSFSIPIGVADWVVHDVPLRIIQNAKGTVMRFRYQTA